MSSTPGPPPPPPRLGHPQIRGSQASLTSHGEFKVPPAVAPHRSAQIPPQPPPKKIFNPPPTESHPNPSHPPNEVAIEVSPPSPEPFQPAMRTDEDKDDDLLSTVSSVPTVEHFNISFEYDRCFREHKGAKAFNSYAQILRITYVFTLRWSYNILLMAMGFVLAILWGLLNALTAFLQTWFLSPFLRVSLVIVKGILPVVLEPLGMLMKTCVNAMGGCPCGGGGLGGGGLGGRGLGGGGFGEGGLFSQNA